MNKKTDEIVDILTPPLFEISGKTKKKEQAHDDEDWIATCNLWIIQSKPCPAIVYQRRSPNHPLAPGLLDVTAGGHYRKGERMQGGLREVEEELGKQYPENAIRFLGRRMYMDYDIKQRLRKNIVYVFTTIDNNPLESYTLQKEEVDSLYILSLSDLMKLHNDKTYSFVAEGITNAKKRISLLITYKSLTYNWDNYHYKIAVVAKKLLSGDTEVFI